MCMFVILQQKDNTAKAQQSPRIPKDLSESDTCPVEKTEKNVSVEGPVAETGRQEVKVVSSQSFIMPLVFISEFFLFT